MKQKKSANGDKKGLHPRNRHRDRYDFTHLTSLSPELKPFVALNEYQIESIDFSDPEAVKTLNKALLRAYYGITFWDLPEGYLCPPVPGRADYIHYAADLLAEGNGGVIPRGKSVKILDIGVGANCIYPIIGHQEYGWRFVGTEVDALAFRVAKQIVSANKVLSGAVDLRLQSSPEQIFKGAVLTGEHFDLCISNPPFHGSQAQAEGATERKWKNLGVQKASASQRNFGGQKTELWYPGGEEAFIWKIIMESAQMPDLCGWYSSFVSKSDSLPGIYNTLKKVEAKEVRTIEMVQGHKASRVVAWRFGE